MGWVNQPTLVVASDCLSYWPQVSNEPRSVFPSILSIRRSENRNLHHSSRALLVPSFARANRSFNRLSSSFRGIQLSPFATTEQVQHGLENCCSVDSPRWLSFDCSCISLLQVHICRQHHTVMAIPLSTKVWLAVASRPPTHATSSAASAATQPSTTSWKLKRDGSHTGALWALLDRGWNTPTPRPQIQYYIHSQRLPHPLFDPAPPNSLPHPIKFYPLHPPQWHPPHRSRP
jgi:hypothetical protein